MALEPVAAPTPPPAPTPAPPTAPQPAPAPPQPPPVSPQTSSGPSQPDENPFNEVFSKAEAHVKKMDSELPKPAAKVEPKEPEAKPDPKQQQKDQPKPKSEPHKLRDELDARTAELTSTKENMSKLESKLKELETKGQDTTKVLERIGQLEKAMEEKVKENEQLSARLKVVRLEEDPEFKREHDEKFNKAAAMAKDFVEKFNVLGPEGTPVRKADWSQDFVKLYYQYKDDPQSALENMTTTFGERATSLLLPKMERLLDLERDRAEKLNEARVKAKEMEQQEQAQVATRKQQEAQVWTSVNKDLEERDPKFRIDPTDKEALEARAESLRIFDGKPKDDQQRIVKHAYIRQMIGNYAVKEMTIARLQKQLADVTAERDSLKNPTPPTAKRPSGGSTDKEPDNEDWATRAKRELAGI